MTEAGWLGCRDPFAMLDQAESGSARKLRLLACAVSRRVWDAMEDDRGQEAVRAAERFADGLIGADEMEEAFGEVAEAMGEHFQSRSAAHDDSMTAASCAAQKPLGSPDLLECLECAARAAGDPDEPAEQTALFRDVYGSPFRPVTLDADRLTTAAVSLARVAYDERHLPSGELDLTRLAVLADALEEAGAPDGLVAHLRGPGPHVRGCWAVDSCLGLS